MTDETDPKCHHGVVFDKEAAQALYDGWLCRTGLDFLMGNPVSSEIRKRWPRLFGKCPNGCGYEGIYYASMDHYIMGDW